jgi:hypothetical protein
MGNIIGEPTPSYVINQVNKRQEIHGKLARSNEELVYLNTKTAWLKLVSSVHITKGIQNPTIKNLGLLGNNLAEKYVLFNGVTNESPREGSEETYQRAGIARDKSIDNTSAYGVGGLEFGLSPMMGLESATISSKNRGSLRTAKVDIIANNRIQFEIIETLYIKLGYFMLLEWGWTNYYTSTEYVKDNPHSLADEFLLRNTGYDDLLRKIEAKRKTSEGNYDALIGKVTNFSWTFTTSGQYRISLDLISQGDVIESLKVNTLLPNDAQSTSVSGSTTSDGESDDGDKEKTTEEIIIAYKDKSSLGRFIASNVSRLDETNRLYKTINGKKEISFIKEQYQGPSTDDKGSTIYYIQFKRLLLWIEENLVPVIKKSKSRFINFDLDTEDNLILLPPISLSTDPRVCNFNSQWTKGGETGYSTLYGAEDFTKVIGKNRYGRLMNVYFNAQWILESLGGLSDENDDVVLIEFLDTLLRAFEASTGNYNTLSADIDPDTNTIIFRDETPQPGRKKDEPTAFFNTFGYNGNNSNFVRNLQFNTTVTPKLATMISIGATRDGYSPGYDATGLQSINYGTYDAIKPDLVNNSGADIEPETPEDKLADLDTKYKEAYKNFQKYVSQLTVNSLDASPILDPTAADAYSSTLKNLIEYKQLKETKSQNKKFAGSPTVGFIPFDLGLEVDGLSGVKIYNKIAVETAFLPYNYPEALEFVVKGVDHTINGNDWTTSLTTLAIPKNPYGGGKSANQTNSPNNSGNKRGDRTIQYFESNTPPDEAKQRAVLTRILDDGTQTLGYLQVYDTSGTKVLYTLATVELPFKNNKNGESCVPVGTYLVNSRQNEKYGKHFWLVGNQEGNFQRIPGGDNTDRTWVLIHRAPKAPGWLSGCIGPSFTYNFTNKNAQGNPDGIGTAYLNPAREQSVQAQEKLVNTLFNEGGFKLVINQYYDELPTKFSSPLIQDLKSSPDLAPLFKTNI